MDAWYHDVVSLITAKIDHFIVRGFLWNGTNDHTLTYQRLGTPRHPGSGPTPDILRVGPMSIWEPLPDKVEQKFKKVLITLTLGNILTMVMVPIPVSAVLAGPDHDQNVP